MKNLTFFGVARLVDSMMDFAMNFSDGGSRGMAEGLVYSLWFDGYALVGAFNLPSSSCSSFLISCARSFSFALSFLFLLYNFSGWNFFKICVHFNPTIIYGWRLTMLGPRSPSSSILMTLRNFEILTFFD